MKQIIIGIIFLLASIGGVAEAQDIPPVPCGSLETTDCKILRQNQEAMLDLESFDFTFSADLTVTDAPDLPETLRFAMVGSGAVTGDTSALMLPANPDDSAEDMARRYSTFDMELSLVLKMPEPLTEDLGGDLPARIPLDIVLVDGIFYLNMSSLREGLGSQGLVLPRGWYGFHVAELAALNAASSDTDAANDALAEVDSDLLAQLGDPAFTEQFYDVQRLDDATAADGAAVATFHTDVDFAGFMNTPVMEQLIEEVVVAQDDTLNRWEQEAVVLFMQMLFEDVTLSMEQTIGLEDYFTRTSSMTMDADLGLAMDMMAMAEARSDAPIPQTAASFIMTITQSNFNAVDDILPPANATVIPLEALGLLPPREQAKPAR